MATLPTDDALTAAIDALEPLPRTGRTPRAEALQNFDTDHLLTLERARGQALDAPPLLAPVPPGVDQPPVGRLPTGQPHVPIDPRDPEQVPFTDAQPNYDPAILEQWNQQARPVPPEVPSFARTRQVMPGTRLVNRERADWLRQQAYRLAVDKKEDLPDGAGMTQQFRDRFIFSPMDIELEAYRHWFHIYRDARKVIEWDRTKGEVRDLVRHIRPQDRQAVLMAVGDLAAQEKPFEEANLMEHTIYAGVQGIESGAMAVADAVTGAGVPQVAGTGWAPEDIEFIQALDGERRERDPARKNQPLLQKWLLEGTEMAGQMLPSAPAMLAGGPAGSLGLAGYWAMQTYPDAQQEMVRAGVDPERAHYYALGSSAIQGAIETLVKNPFAAKAALRPKIRQWLVANGKNYLTELSEEGLQRMTQALALDLAQGAAPDVRKALLEGLAEMKQVAGGLTVMMGPGMARGALATAQQGTARKQRYEAIQAARQQAATGVPAELPAADADTTGADADVWDKRRTLDDPAAWAAAHPRQAYQTLVRLGVRGDPSKVSRKDLERIPELAKASARERETFVKQLLTPRGDFDALPVNNVRSIATDPAMKQLKKDPAYQSGQLADDPELYFKTEGATLVPTGKLISHKQEHWDPKYRQRLHDKHNQAGKQNPLLTAWEVMAAGARGDKTFRGKPIKKRDPILVRDNGNGTYTILDGNATAQVAMNEGLGQLPVRVVENEDQLIDELKGAKKTKDVKTLLKFWSQRDPAELAKVAAAAGIKDFPAGGTYVEQRDAIIMGTFGQGVQQKVEKRIREMAKVDADFGEEMLSLAESLGVRWMHGPVKGAERATFKVVHDYDGDASQMTDVVRGSMVLDPTRKDHDLNFLEKLVVRLRNQFGAFDERYGDARILKEKWRIDDRPGATAPQDVLLVFEYNGVPVELQLHMPEVMAAKTSPEGHRIYESWRVKHVLFEDGELGRASYREWVEEARTMARNYSAALARFTNRTKVSNETNPASSSNMKPGGTGVSAAGSVKSQASSGVTLATGRSPTSANLVPGGKVKSPGSQGRPSGTAAKNERLSATADTSSESTLPSIESIPQIADPDEDKTPQNVEPATVTPAVTPPATTPELSRDDMTDDEGKAWLEAAIADAVAPARAPTGDVGEATTAEPRPVGGKKAKKKTRKKAKAKPKKKATKKTATRQKKDVYGAPAQLAGYQKGDDVTVAGKPYRIGTIHKPQTAKATATVTLVPLGVGTTLVLSGPDFEKQVAGRPEATGPTVAPDAKLDKKSDEIRVKDDAADAPAAPNSKEALRAELKRKAREFRQFTEGRTYATPLDPEVLKRAADLVWTATKYGVVSFRDFVAEMLELAPDILATEANHRYLEAGWAQLGKIDGRLDRSGRVAEVLLAEEVTVNGSDSQTADTQARDDRPATDRVERPDVRGADSPTLGETSDGGSPDTGPTEQPGGDAVRSAGGGSGVSQGAEPDGQPAAGGRDRSLAVRDGGPRRNVTLTPADLPDPTAKSFSAPKHFEANIAAIELLKQLEAEGRLATADEQKTLARYVGWGAIPHAFESNKKEWQPRIARLKQLLTDSEWAAARESSFAAHYTSSAVIQGMWDALEGFGFTGGRVLEPSVGVGHFFGLMPAALRDNSRLHAVELDEISGRITRQLYQTADVRIEGFQDSPHPDGYFDLVIANPPFSNKITPVDKYDRGLSKLNAKLHNFFISKIVRKLRLGGVAAIVVSRFSADAASDYFRNDWKNHANLLGMVRLPETAFKGTAGTEVVTDVLFFQRRPDYLPKKAVSKDSLLFAGPAVVTAFDKDGQLVPTRGDQSNAVTVETTDAAGNKKSSLLKVNPYYHAYPDQVLGRSEMTGSMNFGGSYTVKPLAGALRQQIAKAAKGFAKQVERDWLDTLESQVGEMIEATDAETLPELAQLREGEAFADFKQLRLIRKENGRAVEVPVPFVGGFASKKPKQALGVMRQLQTLQQLNGAARAVIDLERDPQATDKQIAAARKQLNQDYDAAVAKYGPLSIGRNATILKADFINGPAVMALEGWDGKKKQPKKADIFTKRVQYPAPTPTAATPADALAVSLSAKARVDMAYMQEVSGLSEQALLDGLLGREIFIDPETDRLLPAVVYLAGDVRAKLRAAQTAAETDPVFAKNVTALQQVQPADLNPGQIFVKFGTGWVPPEYYRQFAREEMGLDVTFTYSRVEGTWSLQLHGTPAIDLNQSHPYGTKHMGAWDILEKHINHREMVVKRKAPDDDTYYVDRKATDQAMAKAQKLDRDFARWLRADFARASAITELYNERFNNTRLPEYDGSHLQLPGLNPILARELAEGQRPYRRDVVWQILASGNTLIGHQVGAGKTITMVAAAMEMRRTGQWKKPIVVVPNHLVDQWKNEAQFAYPAASILTATEDDFTPTNRRTLLNRIATGDYDLIIVPMTSFEKMPLRPEIQAAFFEEQMRDLEAQIRQVRAEQDDDSNAVKDLEAQLSGLREKLKKMSAGWKKDPGPYFDDLGIDAMMVDEAHNYKNAWFKTKHTRVPGIASQMVQRSFDMLMKTQHLNKLSGHRGVVFATGTPITNSVTEMYVMMRYLRPDLLAARGITSFDAWADTFGQMTTEAEITPTGVGVRTHTRFSSFNNVAELMQIYRQFTDVVTFEDLQKHGLRLPTAKKVDVQSQREDAHEPFMADILKRVEQLKTGQVDPREDNMLKITTDGRKIATDLRLIDPDAPDLENSKVNNAVAKVLEVYRDSTGVTVNDAQGQPQVVDGTQIVWLDYGVPTDAKSAAKVVDDNGNEVAVDESIDRVDLYADIKKKLIAGGIPAEQIAFIHDAKNAKQKAALFQRMRNGEIRVMLATTGRMGTGANVQDRLVASHHLDPPWRPADLEQRNGRMIRQGNWFDNVTEYRYVTKGTFDAYMWQGLERKARAFAQIKNAQQGQRTLEDFDKTPLDFAEVKALAAENPRILELNDLQHRVRMLEAEQASFVDEQFALQGRIEQAGRNIEQLETSIAQRTPRVAVLEAAARQYGKGGPDEAQALVWEGNAHGRDAEAFKQAVLDFDKQFQADLQGLFAKIGSAANQALVRKYRDKGWELQTRDELDAMAANLDNDENPDAGGNFVFFKKAAREDKLRYIELKRELAALAEREAAFAVHGFAGRAWFNSPGVIFERRTVVKQIEIEGDTEGQDTVRRETTERVAQGYGLIGGAGVQMELTVDGQAFGRGVMQKDTDAARLLENVSPQREADQLQREQQELEQTQAQREDQRGQRQERWDKQADLDTARQQLEALQFEMAGGEAERETISKGDVVNAFPGAFVEEIAYGYRVKLGKHSPRVIEVRVVPDIEIDWPAVEKELGREIPPAERATLTAAGRFHFKATGGPNDAGRSGIGVIELVQGLADEKTLRHEALHAARVMGLFSMGQWHALVNKYSEFGKSELEQEEDIAAAAEAWADEDLNLVERLRAWFYELLDRMGVRTIDAETVKVLMKHHTFWQGDAAATEQAPRYQFKKNRRVANPAVDEDARRLVQRVDALWEAAGEPEVRGDAEVNATADARLDSDPAGERARIIEVARAGGSLTDVETVIAKRIINVEAGEALRSGDSDRIDDAIMLIDAYRRTGTEQARAFRQRRETDETPTARRGRLIVESLLQPPREVVEKIEAAREAGDPAAVARVTAQWRQRVMAIKLKLAKMGLDLDNIEALSVDELTAAKTANTISSAKANMSDKFYEYWQNAILSGPTTHAANIVGNFFNASWGLTAQRLTEAMVNTVVQNPKDAQWGEFKHMLTAMLPGISRGARNAVRTWKGEQAFFEAEVLGADAELKDKLDNRRGPAIEGTKGRLIRAVGYRPLLAMDDFFKSIVGEIEASAHAYRIAKGEGLSGAALAGRMKELLGDMGSDAWMTALTSARDLAFQKPLGKAGQWVLKGRTAMPGLRYLIPFITTPVNIFKTGLRKSPLGTLALGVRIGRGIKNGTWEGMTPALAEQMLAWAGVLALMWVIDDEDGDPRITGTEGELSYAKRRTARRTYPTQSIRLGDTWYSYARIEPFATALATTVDWIRALRSKDTGKALRVPFESMVGQVKSKTFLSGLSDLLNALEGDQAEDKLARWASGFTTSWVPNLSKSLMRAGDEEYFERGIWGQGAERYTRLLQRTLQRAELPGVADTPAVDLWGRHTPRDRSPVLSGPITDYLYRLVVPVKNRDHRLHDADRALVNWNAQHPEDERHPLPPRKSYMDAAGEERYMTDAQYHQFLTLAGRAASMIAEVELGDVENPSEADIERIEAALRDGRKLAKAELVKQWAGEQTEALTAFEIARQVHERNIVSHAANLVRLRPLKLEQRERWREQQQRAREFFEGAGIPASEAYDVYRRSLLRMRDPQQRVRKLLRLRANYPKEAA